MNTKTSIASHALIWFGAAISIAEILTGTLIAPLGFKSGLLAILLGHFIGCVLLFLAGLIGGKTEKSGMETVRISFGKSGASLFAVLNVLQLVGWTAVMIYNGAAAADTAVHFANRAVWCVVIGALIFVWILVGVQKSGKLNTVAMAALFLLTIVMCAVVFKGGGIAVKGSITFGAAVELSVAMPLSWLPLISDYTKDARKPVAATWVSTITYFAASVWMYIIGLGAALYTGESDVALILAKAGLGAAALVIVVLSTVTTTFLDVYSTGVSAESICDKWKNKLVAVAVCIIGTLLAIFTKASRLESFLYLIGSVFAPMIAILITDYYLLRTDRTEQKVDWINLCIWLVGFILYRLFMRVDTIVGYTLPAMAAVSILCILVHKIRISVGK